LAVDGQTHKCSTNMQCMTYETSLSLILGVFFVMEIGEEIMNIVDLIIQLLKHCSVVDIVCILWHV